MFLFLLFERIAGFCHFLVPLMDGVISTYSMFTAAIDVLR